MSVPTSAHPTRLLAATSALLEWARSAEPPPPEARGLSLPPGGLESPAVLAWLERTAKAVEEASGERGIWLVVEGQEAVGLVSFKGPPRDGVAEIGYGIAEQRRGRGHATRAVALVIAEADRMGLSLGAETAHDNIASQRVLERNGFVRAGERQDADEGLLVLWRRQRSR